MGKYTFRLINLDEDVRTIDYLGDITKLGNIIIINMRDQKISMQMTEDSLHLERVAPEAKTIINTNNHKGLIKVITEEGTLEFDIKVTKFKRNGENLVMEYQLNNNLFRLLFGGIKTNG